MLERIVLIKEGRIAFQGSRESYLEKGCVPLPPISSMIKELREATGAGPLDCRKALQAYEGNLEKAADYLREQGLSKAARKVGRETRAGLVVVKTLGDCTCAVQVGCETDFVALTDDLRTFVHGVADLVLADAGLTNMEKLLAADLAPGKTTADVIRELIGRLGENITIRRIARYTSDSTRVVANYVHAGDIEGHYGPMEGRLGVLVELGVSDGVAAGSNALRALAHDLTLQIAANRPRYLASEDIPDDLLRQERETLIAQLIQENKPEHIRAKIVQGWIDGLAQEICLLKQAFVKDESVSIEELLEQKSKDIGASVTINRFAHFEVGD